MALEIADLEIGYLGRNSSTSIAKNLNLKIGSGQLICLMGPNGVGKSTLIRTISGLQPPLAGSVSISGQKITSLDTKEKAKLLSVVLTESPSNGLMTVREAIALGRYPHTNWRDEKTSEDLEHIQHAITTVGLEERKDQPLMELSDGYSQKVSIGRALCQDTPLIVLDEPTVHLDVRNKREVMELLHSLCKKQDKSVLISTHDLTLARTFADKIWLFDKGEVKSGLPHDLILSGAFEEVFGEAVSNPTAPDSELKLALVGSTTVVEITAEALARRGIALSTESELIVKITSENGVNLFEIQKLDFSAKSIEELIQKLLEIQ